MGEKKGVCEFGKEMEIGVMEKEKRKEWLIEKVKEDSGGYFEGC